MWQNWFHCSPCSSVVISEGFQCASCWTRRQTSYDDCGSRYIPTVSICNKRSLALENLDLTDFCDFKILRELKFILSSTSNGLLLIEVHYLIKNWVVWGSNNSNQPMQNETVRIICFHNFELYLVILKFWRTKWLMRLARKNIYNISFSVSAKNVAQKKAFIGPKGLPCHHSWWIIITVRELSQSCSSEVSV